MKTYQDFDLKAIKKAVFEWGESHHLSKEGCEKFFNELLKEEVFQKLNIKVPCKTCGIKYPLNALDHECQEEDIWLCRYIQNSILHKEVPKHLLSKLKEKYPFKKKSAMAFRGINFETKKDYESFIESIKDGFLVTDTITSWSLDIKEAIRFARIAQKGTRKTDEEWKHLINKLVEEKANVTGYKGVILGIDVRKKMVLADISEHRISNMDEKELILFPGRYKVYIIHEIDKQVGVNDWGKEALEILESL